MRALPYVSGYSLSDGNNVFSWDVVLTNNTKQELKTEEVNLAKLLYVKKIYADPAKKTTVVVWADGTKTKVKCSDEDVYSLEAGFWAALAKKVYGSYEDYSRFFNHRKVVITSKANL